MAKIIITQFKARGGVFALLLVLVLVFSSQTAQAVLPPDFLFNLGAQIVQAFSVIVLFLSSILGIFYHFLKNNLFFLKRKKLVLALVVVLVLGVSFGAAHFYGRFRQQKEYEEWLAQTQRDELNYQYDFGSNANGEAIDKLDIGVPPAKLPGNESEKFISNISVQDGDLSARFISDYYKNIAEGNVKQAYEMSKKSVSRETFESWYEKTSKISLDKMVRIDEKRVSLELTLYEGQDYARYGVLMELALDIGGNPFQVQDSQVRILGQGRIVDETVEEKNIIDQEYGFFEKNKTAGLAITNDELKAVTGSPRNDYIVLDAREDVEYENGNFPGSLHIRFADIQAGRWIEIPNDKFVYVICWSGIRGREVAEFLRTKKIVASYLKDGANGWVNFGGKWDGSIKFSEKYSEARFQKVFSTAEVREKETQGVRLVDSREPSKYKKWHIPRSVSIPIMYTPSAELDAAFSQIPPNSEVINVCDGYVNCFDAKVTGVELEKRGFRFLGRYITPWEYPR